MQFFIRVLITLVLFTLVDLLWLVKVAPKLYRRFLGHLMANQVNKIAALLFYVIFIIGLVYFVITPSEGQLVTALLSGALFGLVTYATYDLTNLATLKQWPIEITIIDLVWGSFVTGVTSLLVTLILNGLAL